MAYYCSKSKEEISEAEYNYSIKKYGVPLSRKEQKKFSASVDSKSDKKSNTNGSSIKDDSKGLSEKEERFREGMIKGRIAETLIEELFLSLGYNVFRYGMENTVPGIMDLLKGVRSDVAYNIRRMPDFVVQNKKNGAVYFIEVKFRAKEEFKFGDLSKDYPYKNCYFILVSKKHIKCITYEELKDGGDVTPKTQNYLGNRKEFDLDKPTIIKFCDFAVKFFDKV
jgi:hypothetical protein